jgi:hypothetical protein
MFPYQVDGCEERQNIEKHCSTSSLVVENIQSNAAWNSSAFCLTKIFSGMKKQHIQFFHITSCHLLFVRITHSFQISVLRGSKKACCKKYLAHNLFEIYWCVSEIKKKTK